MRWAVARPEKCIASQGPLSYHARPLLPVGKRRLTHRTCREPQRHSNDVSVLFGRSGLVVGDVRELPMLADLSAAIRSPRSIL